MDITASMMATVRNRSAFPNAYDCGAGPLCAGDAQQTMRQNYAAKVERLDGLLGEYLDELDKEGELDNTVVCLCSDHGEMLGDRASTAKSKPWRHHHTTMSAMSVPLVCAGPGVAAGAVVRAPVTTMDMAATFVDYARAA
eukprot:gene42673-25925_t